ncbi:MAG: TraB/GumN family protein [Defluviitaleaceae bacterium]|nr:TraB/GumN family protein [Defluviitaleaceae bacterium]
MKIRATQALFAIIVFTLALTACAPAAAQTATPQGIHGKLSRIEHGDNVAYILGSMHAGRPEWFPLSPIVEDAMRRADAFVFEYDMSIDQGSLEMMLLVMEHMFMPTGVTLETLLPPDSYANFVENIATFNWIDYSTASNMHPMAIAQVVTYEVLSELDVSTEYSVDMYVYNFAAEHGLPVSGLNSIESELTIVFNMSDDVKIAMMEDFPSKAEMLEEGEELALADAYESNNLEGLLHMLQQSYIDADSPAVRFMQDTLMHKRCVIFADEIERLMLETEEPTTFFITVGLAHIIGGEAGKVLYILEDRGFEVTGLYH